MLSNNLIYYCGCGHHCCYQTLELFTPFGRRDYQQGIFPGNLSSTNEQEQKDLEEKGGYLSKGPNKKEWV